MKSRRALVRFWGYVVAAFVVAIWAGCATSSINSRKAQHQAAYDALSPEMKALVDQGQITEGMDTNAVLIALGPPSQVVSAPSGGGDETTWVYTSTYTQQVPNWTMRPSQYGYETYDYTPQALSHGYTKAIVTFQNGRVTRWKNFPPGTTK